jgi:hypothetical protein
MSAIILALTVRFLLVKLRLVNIRFIKKFINSILSILLISLILGFIGVSFIILDLFK